ncbi:MAG: PQQ-binding-like beta-propeller repeat protein [Aquabacterium sp.]
MHSASVKYLPAKDDKPALVYMGDVIGNVYALNAQTGVPVWVKPLGISYPYHMVTGGMQVHEDTLYVPISSREVSTIVMESLTQGKVCCSTHGLLQAVNAYTGEIKWTYHTTPPAALDATTGMMAPSGASVWGTPMIDAERRQVVIGTGQNFSRPTTTTSDAIIALDMDTGSVKWSFQANANDAYTVACDAPVGYDIACPPPVEANRDFDFGAPPMLVSMPPAWGGKAIVAGGKNGVVYNINPSTGHVNWVRRLGVGGSLGGVHWGMASDKFRVYVGITDFMGDKAKRIEEFQGGVTTGQAVRRCAAGPVCPGPVDRPRAVEEGLQDDDRRGPVR